MTTKFTESPAFNKTYDFLVWWLQHTDKFPRHERFRLGQRSENAAFAVYENLQKAVKLNRIEYVRMADIELATLRLCVRLCYARKLLQPNQYAFAAEKLSEIGRLLGGWLKPTPQTNPPN